MLSLICQSIIQQPKQHRTHTLPYDRCADNPAKFLPEMGKTTVIYSLEFAWWSIFVSSPAYTAMFLHCCYAAGAVLLGLAYAGSSIPQHGSSSLTPPAMLLGCCYVTCTDAELYRLWRGIVLRSHMFCSNKFINPCAADCCAFWN